MKPIARLARMAVMTGALLAGLGLDVRADHDHSMMAMHAEDSAEADQFTAKLGFVAADVDTMFYVGDYQGAGLTAGWQRGPLAIGAGLTGYRINKNGRAIEGIGDVDLHAQLVVLTRGAVVAGVMFGLSLPTGDPDEGLGMGHVMAMPGGFAALSTGRLTLSVNAGFGQALAKHAESAHAQHGGGMAWPIVAPMYSQEVTFGGGAEVAIASKVHGTVHAAAAIPTGRGGVRSLGAGGLGWTHGRFESRIEVQVALSNEPFGVRGVVETGVQF